MDGRNVAVPEKLELRIEQEKSSGFVNLLLLF